MESNPGYFGVKAVVHRAKYSDLEESTVILALTMGDARRLLAIMKNGFPDNVHNSLHGLRLRLVDELGDAGVDENELG